MVSSWFGSVLLLGISSELLVDKVVDFILFIGERPCLFTGEILMFLLVNYHFFCWNGGNLHDCCFNHLEILILLVKSTEIPMYCWFNCNFSCFNPKISQVCCEINPFFVGESSMFLGSISHFLWLNPIWAPAWAELSSHDAAGWSARSALLRASWVTRWFFWAAWNLGQHRI